MRNVKRYDLSTLVGLQEFRYDEIDARTGSLISNGYVHSTKSFSLSQNAQINISGLNQSRDDVALTYPIEFTTLDNLDVHDVVDAAEIHTMYLTALATKKAHLDSGGALKNQIRAAVDIAAVNAIIDNR